MTISEIPAIKTKYLEILMDSKSSQEMASVNIRLCYVIFHIAFNTGTGKPAVPDKRVPQVRVWYPIWHTQAKLRTRGAVSWVWAGIYSINLLEVYEFICT